MLHTRVLAYFDSVWGGGCGAARSTRVAPEPTPTRECRRILSASDGIWNMLFSTYCHTSCWVRFSGCLVLFSTYSHTFKRVRSNGCLSSVVAQASAICSNCLHRSPNSPFALSRLANLTHAVAARLSLSISSWQHVYRRVLHELDIEFEPGKNGRGSFCTACSYHGSLRRLTPAPQAE